MLPIFVDGAKPYESRMSPTAPVQVFQDTYLQAAFAVAGILIGCFVGRLGYPVAVVVAVAV
jgi:hypothetical protein